VIELRQAAAQGDLPERVAGAVDDAVARVAELYLAPDATRWSRAERAVELAIDIGMQVPSSAQSRCRTILAQLHILRGALRDDETALAAYITPKEIPDAP
jgi:hypothetical protein